MPAQILRPYQQNAVNQILALYRSGARRVLVVAPTGSGKTTVFASILANGNARGIVLTHRRELVTQASNRLREFGTDHGLILAGAPARPMARVQVASVQTLTRRTAPPADFVVCDEAHLSTADTWSKILAQYPHARILGVTATPWRLGGKPLIGAYDASVVVATPAELCAQGYLCGYQGFSYLAPDLSKVGKVGDDYNQQQSAAAMSAIVPNVVEQWLKHASGLSTVVFAVTVEHSKALCAEFVAAGVRAEHLDGGTPIEQRRATLGRVDRGETRVLVNVGIAVEGLDLPRLKCCVLARPTMSLARAIQMMGRVRRPFEGQTARIHDHAFVIAQHGLPDSPRDYTLHAKDVDAPALPSLTTCQKCFALFTGRVCPACAEVNPTGEREIREITDAELFEFASGQMPAPTASELPAVRVEWTAKGKTVEGVYRGQGEEQSNFGGVRRLYTVEGARRLYTLPGTSELDKKMARAVLTLGQKVKIVYTGEREIGGGRSMKTFTVEADDGSEEREQRARGPEVHKAKMRGWHQRHRAKQAYLETPTHA